MSNAKNHATNIYRYLLEIMGGSFRIIDGLIVFSLSGISERSKSNEEPQMTQEGVTGESWH